VKISLIGTRGIPAQHGGFETCVEEVGERLVKKGHSVTVYSKRVNNARIRKYFYQDSFTIRKDWILSGEIVFATYMEIILAEQIPPCYRQWLQEGR
jgi:hypothetical protein